MSDKYFSGLNYTLGNEDSTVEIELIKKFKPKSIFSICGSGGRSIPLIHPECLMITLSDLSPEQLYLAELRHATYKELSHQDFLKFWGYFPYTSDNNQAFRREVFVKLNLSAGAYAFMSQVFHEIKYDSVLYLGKWESTFNVFAKICKVVMGKEYDRIMRFDNLEDQIYYYKNNFPMKRWKAMIHLLGNKTMFNALLYKGDFITKNSPLSHFEYYFSAFERLFTTDLAQKSFFLNLCFYGKITSLQGVPVEASEESFNRVKSSNSEVLYAKEDFVAHLKSGKTKYDFLSLSDVPSYFGGDLEENFMQMIRPGLHPGAIVVLRYYLRTSKCNLDGYQEITNDYLNLLEFEKVQMYEIKIYKYLP
jgi:S-adenosylmethionine-diacylglycerol 3-amino-3-carboxypropyl transferase